MLYSPCHQQPLRWFLFFRNKTKNQHFIHLIHVSFSFLKIFLLPQTQAKHSHQVPLWLSFIDETILPKDKNTVVSSSSWTFNSFWCKTDFSRIIHFLMLFEIDENSFIDKFTQYFSTLVRDRLNYPNAKTSFYSVRRRCAHILPLSVELVSCWNFFEHFSSRLSICHPPSFNIWLNRSEMLHLLFISNCSDRPYNSLLFINDNYWKFYSLLLIFFYFRESIVIMGDMGTGFGPGFSCNINEGRHLGKTVGIFMGHKFFHPSSKRNLIISGFERFIPSYFLPVVFLDIKILNS